MGEKQDILKLRKKRNYTNYTILLYNVLYNYTLGIAKTKIWNLLKKKKERRLKWKKYEVQAWKIITKENLVMLAIGLLYLWQKEICNQILLFT